MTFFFIARQRLRRCIAEQITLPINIYDLWLDPGIPEGKRYLLKPCPGANALRCSLSTSNGIPTSKLVLTQARQRLCALDPCY